MVYLLDAAWLPPKLITWTTTSAFVIITSQNGKIKVGERFVKQVFCSKNIILQCIFKFLLTYFLPQTTPRTNSFFSAYFSVNPNFRYSPANFMSQSRFTRQLFSLYILCRLLSLSAGADPCACLPPDTQPSPTGHSADRGGADPHCPANRTHPAPPEGRVRPRPGWLWKENQRVSNNCG